MFLPSANLNDVNTSTDAWLDALRRNEIKFVELGQVEGQPLNTLARDSLNQLAATLEQAGVRVSVIATQLGRQPVEESFEPQLALLENYAAAARTLGTRYLRVVTPSFRPGRSVEIARKAIIARLRLLTERAAVEGMVLLFENRPDSFGSAPERMADLIRVLDSDNVGLIFNPAGFLLTGKQAFDECWPLLKEHVLHIRIKDAVGGRPARSGAGDAQLIELLRAAAQEDFHGFAMFEPRVPGSNTRRGFEAGFAQAVRAARSTFDAAGARHRLVRVALVGLGGISDIHRQALWQTDEAILVAGCDAVPAARERFEQAHGCPAFPDVKSMLGRVKPDAVTVCTPSGMHAESSLPALRKGVHALVEKPLDITLPNIDRMIETARNGRVHLACVFQGRFEESMRRLKDLVEQRRYGRPLLGVAMMKWYRSQAYYDSGAWRGAWEMDGGGCLMNQAIHFIDRLLFVMGEVVEVTAMAERLDREIEVEDNALAMLRFRSGALGAIVASTTCAPGFSTELEIFCERGGVMLRDDQVVQHRTLEGQAAVDFNSSFKPISCRDVLTRDERLRRGGSHYPQMQDFIDAIREEREPYVTGEEGRRAVEVILAMYESAATRKPVSLPLKPRKRPLHGAMKRDA